MENKTLVLEKENKQNLTLEENTHIIAKENSNSVLILEVRKAQKIRIEIEVRSGAFLTLFYNNTSPDYEVEEEISIYRNGKLKLAYCELESKKLSRKATVKLLEEGAEVTLISGAIADSKKHQEILCDHFCGNTTSNMETYGVIISGGDYQVVANGRIEKGAIGAKTHQTSRVLTFAEKQKAEVIPMLEIEENDVEASHATSIGQLDENQLYYLMSRGITQQEALRLISLGYLLPLTKVADDDKLRQYLTQLIEKKVAEACLM